MKRCGGVLLHVSSLPGEYGIGTLGKEAYSFIDFLEKAGFGAWQVLPLSPCDSYNSPYSGASAYAGNIFFIDPEILFEKGLLTSEELTLCKCSDIYTTQYSFINDTREDIFKKAFSRLDEKAFKEIDSFKEENPWVLDYALFCALKKKHHGLPWYEWDEGIKLRKEKELESAKEELKEEIDFYIFLQCEFFTQWGALKKYANEKGIGIIGDMPIYLAHDSADTWANPKLFSLDENLFPAKCAGVPPDYFCEDGQKWGNPLYNWEEMKKDGYSFWVKRIEHSAKMYDSVRIDHFRAFSAYWEIPAGESAKSGKWQKGPGMDLFNVIKKRLPDADIIAEDLGDIDEDVIKLLKDTGFPGMGVMQFGFISSGNSPHLPHNYSEKTIGYTGTHDNTTLLAWLWEANPATRSYALDYCGFNGDWGQGGADSPAIRSFIRTLWRSGALLSIVPIQDLCGFGGDTCMNHPGTAEGNWCFRLTKSALSQIDTSFYKNLNDIYHRGKFNS